MRLVLSVLLLLFVYACNPPPVENVYRKENRFPGGVNVPVAFLMVEWGGKPRVMGSAWLIDGGHGALFTAKHVTDAFMNNAIELGANECKVFLNGKVYNCIIVQIPPLRDAVVFKILGSFNQSDLPKPYKISTTKLKIGDRVFVQGFHPHSSEITKSNLADGFKELIIPIFKIFYELRMADSSKQIEVVFDSLEAVVVDTNFHASIEGQEPDVLGELKLQSNEFIKVVTLRNHKFSFGGLSGGVVIKINDQGVSEAVGIITAELPARFKYDKNGQTKGGSVSKIEVYDTLCITPTYSIKDLYDYARQMK